MGIYCNVNIYWWLFVEKWCVLSVSTFSNSFLFCSFGGPSPAYLPQLGMFLLSTAWSQIFLSPDLLWRLPCFLWIRCFLLLSSCAEFSSESILLLPFYWTRPWSIGVPSRGAFCACFPFPASSGDPIFVLPFLLSGSRTSCGIFWLPIGPFPASSCSLRTRSSLAASSQRLCEVPSPFFSTTTPAC